MVFQSLRGPMAQQIQQWAFNQKPVGVACSIPSSIRSTNIKARHESQGSLMQGCCNRGLVKQRQGTETTNHGSDFLKSVFVKM